MKKLTLALSAALLLLSACGEKTATYSYKNAEITYPASWAVEENDSFLTLKDQDAPINFVNVRVSEMEEQSLAAMSSEDLAESLQNMAYSLYQDSLEEDCEISFESDFGATDTQAMMSVSGTANGEPFVGTVSAWFDESTAFITFVSAKDDKARSNFMGIIKFNVQ